MKLLLAASDELGDVDTYRFDLVDVARQMMSDISQRRLHPELRAAKGRGGKRYAKARQAWYDALLDCDRLLRTHEKFQFGRYLMITGSRPGTQTQKAPPNERQGI